jgi:uncharacterized membrane protein (UPF0127 family)
MFMAAVTSTSLFALERKPLTINSATGPHTITVEVAKTREEQMTGLMFRRSIGADEGMIFIYPQDQEISMWMKNTYIPLDMIFIRHEGTVLHVERDTEPLSERIISSGDQARAVVEMAAGSAQRLGIEPGDRIDFPDLK